MCVAHYSLIKQEVSSLSLSLSHFNSLSRIKNSATIPLLSDQTHSHFNQSSFSLSWNFSEAEGMIIEYVLGFCAKKLCLLCARARALISPFLSSLFSQYPRLGQIDQPRWDDLPMDCLVNVLEKVGMRSLLLDVPFVCKSWYRASLHPLCWQRLIFVDTETKMDLETHRLWRYHSEIEAEIDIQSDRLCFESLMSRFVSQYQIDASCFSDTAFITSVVNRSRGHATFLRLPGFCPEAALKYVGDVCHELKGLSLPRRLLLCSSSIVKELIGKCKHLELLSLGGSHNLEEILLQFSMGCCRNFLNINVPAVLMNRQGAMKIPYLIPNVSFLSSYNLEEILAQIRIHCKNFCHLNMSGALIKREDMMAIVNLLPRIKYLILRKAYIDRGDLLTLLRGCTELVLLDARDCSGFDEGDVEISVLASHIGKFSCEGSKCVDDPLLWLRTHISI